MFFFFCCRTLNVCRFQKLIPGADGAPRSGCDVGSVYSSWWRPCKIVKLSEVGGGRVSLTSKVLLWSFTQWKLRSFFGINLLVAVPTTLRSV